VPRKEDIFKLLENIDREFVKKNTPIKFRWWLACGELAKEQDLFPNGFRPLEEEGKIVEEFYETRYGDSYKIYLRGPEVPIMIWGQVYYYRIPIMFNFTVDKFNELDFIDQVDMHDPEISRLRNDINELIRYRNDVAEHINTDLFSGDRKNFDGFSDYVAAVASLKSELFNVVAWQTLQCAEKALKKLLNALGVSKKTLKKNYSHNLKKLWSKLHETNELIDGLETEIDICYEDNVDFRYSNENLFSIEESCNKVRAALKIWATCSDLFQYQINNSAPFCIYEDEYSNKICTFGRRVGFARAKLDAIAYRSGDNNGSVKSNQGHFYIKGKNFYRVFVNGEKQAISIETFASIVSHSLSGNFIPETLKLIGRDNTIKANS